MQQQFYAQGRKICYVSAFSVTEDSITVFHNILRILQTKVLNVSALRTSITDHLASFGLQFFLLALRIKLNSVWSSQYSCYHFSGTVFTHLIHVLPPIYLVYLIITLYSIYVNKTAIKRADIKSALNEFSYSLYFVNFSLYI